MKIVINSHINSGIALNHLLESLDDCEYEIIIVIGGYFDLKNYNIYKYKNITYIQANHNSIDFTGLIVLVELYYEVNEYYVYLHDTCKVGKDFYNKIKAIDLTNVSSIKIKKSLSMNIGIYSQKIINQFTDFLLSKKNIDESKCMEYKYTGALCEDYIFKNDCNNITLDNYDGNQHTEPTDYYKTGVMRIVEYYPNLDIYKIKANWFMRDKDKWVLDN